MALIIAAAVISFPSFIGHVPISYPNTVLTKRTVIITKFVTLNCLNLDSDTWHIYKMVFIIFYKINIYSFI